MRFQDKSQLSSRQSLSSASGYERTTGEELQENMDGMHVERRSKERLGQEFSGASDSILWDLRGQADPSRQLIKLFAPHLSHLLDRYRWVTRWVGRIHVKNMVSRCPCRSTQTRADYFHDKFEKSELPIKEVKHLINQMLMPWSLVHSWSFWRH